MLKKILSGKVTVFAALILLLVFGVFGFFHYRDAVFSKEIVSLQITGPKKAAMGQEVEYAVTYKNNSNFTLEEARLVFELPDYSLTEDGKLRLTQDVKDIRPGEERLIRFPARLLGKEGDVKTARASFSYVPHNLSARYESDAKFTTNIEAVPIILENNLPAKFEKNKETTLTVNYFSDVDYPLENVSIKVEPMGGFSVASSDPESLDNIEWKFPVLEKNGHGKIVITGTATGDVGTKLTFLVHLGMRIRGIFVVLKEAKQEVEITEPQLVISQQINGSANYTANAGETLNYRLVFKNIGATQIDVATATAKLSGSALETGSPQTFSFSLPALASGQEIIENFSIRLKTTITDADQMIKNTVTAAGVTQTFETNVKAGSIAPPPLELTVPGGWLNP